MVFKSKKQVNKKDAELNEVLLNQEKSKNKTFWIF